MRKGCIPSKEVLILLHDSVKMQLNLQGRPKNAGDSGTFGCPPSKVSGMKWTGSRQRLCVFVGSEETLKKDPRLK